MRMQLPPLDQLLASMRVVALPLKTSFRGVTHREYVVFEGPQGWGEFGPFHDHTLEHSANWLRAAIEAAYQGFPASVRDDVAVNAIVPELHTRDVDAWVRDAYNAYGVTTFKVKCGSQDFRDDVNRVDEIRYVLDHLGIAEWSVRIDVNGRWSVDQAIERIKELNDVAAGRIEYVEQPVQSLADCATVRNKVDVKIAVDEGIRLAAEGQLSLDAIREAADVAIVKAIPLGGVANALDVVTALNLPTVVSGSMDSSVGLASGLALAGCVPTLLGACGFGTGQILAEDLVTHSLLPVGGRMRIAAPAPDAELLERAAARVDSATENYWRARVTACYDVLEEE
jgi:O-succinylbenzoate synthase